MHLPLVSIIIPVYNGSNYLKEAIDSALAQTYKNIEVIVVNDGSTDNGATERIALSYGDNIRYFCKPNGGVSSALNMGIDNMKGEYFSWLSHDDKYLPDKIRVEVDALLASKSAALVACGIQNIDSTSTPIGISRKFSGLTAGHHPWHEALNYMLMHGSYNGCSLLIPRKAFDEDTRFDETLRYCQDAKMWMQIFLKELDLIYIPDVLVCNRIHGGQLTQTGRDLLKEDSTKIASEIAPRLAATVPHAKELLFSYAFHNAVLGITATVQLCQKEANASHLFSFGQHIRIFFATMYGAIRPLIRKLYYSFIRKL